MQAWKAQIWWYHPVGWGVGAMALRRKATLSGDLLGTVLSISLLIFFISELLLEFGNFGKRILIGLLHAHGRALGLVVVAKVLLAIQADGGDAFERLLLPWKRHRSAPFLFASCFLPGCKP